MSQSSRKPDSAVGPPEEIDRAGAAITSENSRESTNPQAFSAGNRQADDLELPPSLKRDTPATGRKVHPLADIFPMMSDDELADLAADIKANGLVHPIVVDAADVVIDGRNRLKACKMAGVEPRFTKLNGQDPAAFILSVNINRRHLTAGQRAMAVAFIYPEPEKGGRGKNQEARKATETGGFSATRLKLARSVLRSSRPLAERVLAGSTPLDKALEEMAAANDLADAEQTKLLEVQTKAPDLAVRIADGGLSLDEAHSLMAERMRKCHEMIQAAARRAGSLAKETRACLVALESARSLFSSYSLSGAEFTAPGIVAEDLENIAADLAALKLMMRAAP